MVAVAKSSRLRKRWSRRQGSSRRYSKANDQNPDKTIRKDPQSADPRKSKIKIVRKDSKKGGASAKVTQTKTLIKHRAVDLIGLSGQKTSIVSRSTMSSSIGITD